MALRSFAIPRMAPDASQEELQAWNYMQQQLDLRAFTPTLTDFTGTAPTTNRGYYQLLGPVVFFFIHLKSSSNFGWDSGATISLPFPTFIHANATAFPQYAQPIMDVTTGLEVNNECPLVTATGLTLSTALSSTGGPTEVSIQGFYLRN